MTGLHPQLANRAADMARAYDADTQLVAPGRLRKGAAAKAKVAAPSSARREPSKGSCQRMENSRSACWITPILQSHNSSIITVA